MTLLITITIAMTTKMIIIIMLMLDMQMHMDLVTVGPFDVWRVLPISIEALVSCRGGFRMCGYFSQM